MKSTIPRGLILAMAAGSMHADTLGLVAADSVASENAAQQAFVATGKFSSVTIIDTQTSTPAVAALKDFTHILAWSVAAPQDRVALGNVLADYYDLGGKHLTVATYAFSTVPSVSPFFLPDPEIQGRIMAAPYAALTNTNLIGNLSGSLVAMVAGDTVWTGVDPATVLYFENQYMSHPNVAAGATLVAADGAGASAIPLIARSQNGVVNVNFYPGGPQGTTAGNNNPALFQVLNNTFPAAQTVTDTIPPTTSAAVQPGPNAQGWNNSNATVLLTSVDNPGGSGVKQVSVTMSGAQTGSSVTAGNSVSNPVTTEGSTTLTYSATDNAGNVETAKMVTVMLDKTPPSVTATANPLPDGGGINTTPVTVTFTGTDTLSGVSSCTKPITLTASGTATGTCTDNAGNTSAPVSKAIKIAADPPGPVIHGVPAAGQCVLRRGHELVRAATLWVDAGQATSFDVTATSNETPDKDKKDIVIKGTGLAPRIVELRPERPEKGTALIYTVTATAANKSGQTVDTFICAVAPSEGDDDDHEDHEEVMRRGQ